MLSLALLFCVSLMQAREGAATACPRVKVAVEQLPDLHIARAGHNTVYAGDFYITDGKNNGLCGVAGTLEALYKNNYEYIPGVGLRVYIQEQGSPSIDNVRSDGKGGFTFVKLKPNTTYTVYAENETEKGAGINFVSQEIKTGEAGTISVMEKPLQVIIY